MLVEPGSGTCRGAKGLAWLWRDASFTPTFSRHDGHEKEGATAENLH